MTMQDLQFELIERTAFNAFDGPRVANGLRAHRELWAGVMFGRFQGFTLLPLRDIASDVWAGDTLAILSSRVDDAALEALAGSWGADEVAWVSERESAEQLGDSLTSHLTGENPYHILLAWWD